MLVNSNGNILNVTNEFTLGQLLKNGATLVENVEATEEVTALNENKEPIKNIVADEKKPARRK